MKNTLALAALTLALCATLAGCGTAATSTQTGTQTEQGACTRLNTGNSDPIITQCDITLNDTRHVTCLTSGIQKGITCDWAHASGSDEEPTR